MDITSFWHRHKSAWAELEQLVERFTRQPRKINADEINRLTLLYKKTSAHLAYIRTFHPTDEVTLYLNLLVSRAHNLTYRQQGSSWYQLKHFFGHHLVQLVQQRMGFVAVAALLFLIGGAAGFAAVLVDPLNVYYVLPQGMAEQINPAQLGEGHESVNSPVLSTMIMTNNIKVAMLAFVGGITLGILPIYLLLFNGLLVGALAGVYALAGSSYAFWAYILPHGVIELTAIFLAGGAGLHMGYRLLVPGRYNRKHQFLIAAKQSAQLLLATLPLFVVAGLIEGYITPSKLSLETKYGVALLTLVILAAWYSWGLARLRRTHNASLDLISK
ncbi:stage II sporulation protein M [Brevibacillus choshinensis]|uniref:Stage II sporulation protein M n=1 Tax=Brevibacillus choshinensis TaxID=54911 RepID=A0ABX7FIP1_BRECH|nr:stage II sporulation protein M [Brevibacillus choshinensis]QRG65604.1 stage II sporulation protein M [Brevibacillus choshinensis]